MKYTDYVPDLTRSNMFLNLNGWPYLSGEYLNEEQLQTVDRSLISNQLLIDNTDSSTAIVDLVLDNVGETSIGNRTAYNRFLETVSKNHSLRGYLDVIRPGMTVDIDYRLESERTGALIRIVTASMFIRNKGMYLDVDGKDFDDRAILSNFSDSTVRTISNRTYGSDRLIVRLTRVRLNYVGLRTAMRNPYDERPRPDLNEADIFSDCTDTRYNPRYHQSYEPQYSFSDENIVGGTRKLKPHHHSHSVYYHFDDNGRTVVLHPAEIANPSAPIFSIPIGTVNLNKSFIANSVYKILFKVSVWKNDVIAVNNTRKIAELLGGVQDCHCGETTSPHDPHGLISGLSLEKHRNDMQDNDIGDLQQLCESQAAEILALGDRITILEGGTVETVVDPVSSPDPSLTNYDPTPTTTTTATGDTTSISTTTTSGTGTGGSSGDTLTSETTTL